MKLPTLPALVVLSITLMACDRRSTEPVESADTANTAVVDTPAATMPTDTVTTPPPATATGTCEGLTGQPLTDCLALSGPTTTDPTMTDPTMTDPTAPAATDGAMNGTGTSTDTDTPTPTDADATTPPQS